MVLAPPAADALHPAFSNLFVQTEIVRRAAGHPLHAPAALAATRQSPWMFHLMAVHGADVGDDFLRDRSHALHRPRPHASPRPRAMRDRGRSRAAQGSVLDPIVAIRCRITLEPDQSATIDMVSGVADDARRCPGLVGKVPGPASRRPRLRAGLDAQPGGPAPAQRQRGRRAALCRLAGSIIYANPSLRADAQVFSPRIAAGSPGCGATPSPAICRSCCCRSATRPTSTCVRQLVQAHAYWRLKGLAVDLVIWNEDHAGYRQQLQDQIMGLIAAGVEAHVMDRPGGIFVRPAEQISDEDRILFQTVARAIISDRRGTLADQINRRGLTAARAPHLNLPRFKPTRAQRAELPPPAAPARSDLLFVNGLGGFTPDGREYVITTAHDQVTPAPWVNVLANPHFGTVISESGTAYTWGENAHEFRLTPWHNDPVSDASGEAFYLRDEESGHFWSPTPLPSRGATPYVSRHGFGYSVFEHTRGRHRLGTVGLRGAGRRGQVLGVEGAQRVGPRAPALASPATSNGCWATCGRRRPCT